MTKPNVKALLEIANDADTVNRNASMLKHNVKNRRVTHTVQVIRQLVNAVARVCYAVEDEATFIRAFEAALLEAHVGMVEIELGNNGTEIYIGGAFSIEKLQQLIVVATVPPLVKAQ